MLASASKGLVFSASEEGHHYGYKGNDETITTGSLN